MSQPDPFGTAALRQTVLRTWQTSPTRFREDANAEEDLRIGGYRNRLLVELAQNAADAAGSGGVLRITFTGTELRVANTGQPLTPEGVAALAALRASAKRDQRTVGRFGVGFAAVLSVTDAPQVVSTTGGVAFSKQATAREVAQLPGPAEELQRRAGSVPVLRLPWPADGTPPDGFTTEVRLPLRDDVDVDELLASFADQAPGLLLALPALTEIQLGEQVWRRQDQPGDQLVIHGPQRTDRWLVHRASGTLRPEDLADLGAETRETTEWQLCWAVPLDERGAPTPLAEDVLHAPTPTEERLSLPARLVATVPVEADRRRTVRSAATDAVLAAAAECYPHLVGKLAPEQRTALVPLPGFPLSDTDEELRRQVNAQLRTSSWLPAAAGGTVAPARARALDFVSAELVDLLRDVIPGLLPADLSEAHHRRALHAVEVPRLGTADLVEAVTGLDRPPHWWRLLYDALVPVENADPVAREELAALPVPLADGRTASGVRGVLLSQDGEDRPGPANLLSALDISGLRIAHPQAAHPLLEKLGAHPAGADELLDSPPLAEAVRRSAADARSGVQVQPLAEAVLELLQHSSLRRDWLGKLALPDSDGGFRPAEELVLPDAALLDVLADDAVGEDAPLGVLAADFAQNWPRELLTSIGVRDTFLVQVTEEPVEPDEDLPDSRQWWAEQEALRPEEWPPAVLTAVHDLDLVADDCWPAAIRLLSSRPDTARELHDQQSYTAWWISRYALLDGRAPRDWRLPDAHELVGLYDPVPELGLTTEQLALAGVRGELSVTGPDDAADLLERLGDRARSVRAGTALRAHRVLADAVAQGVVDPAELDPPETVRSVSGAVVNAERAVVLDVPWMLGALEAPLVVAGGGPDDFDAEALAELLDLPLASEENTLQVVGSGKARNWRELSRVPAACELVGITVPDGQVVLHDELRVRSSQQEHRVHWWVEPTGVVHAERTPDGLGRALAWAADEWQHRFTLTALLADPEATTLLR